MGSSVTLQTIADRVGVSRMTVSNAFSRPDQLSAELRSRILEEADALGYCGPDPAGRNLSRGRSGTIGVLFTDRLPYAFSDAMATRFLSGIAEVLEAHELGITVMSSPRGEGAGAVSTTVVDGLVVYSVDGDSPGLVAARRRQIPLVFADQRPERGIPCVVADDRGGAAAAARHLVALGHRRVAIVTVAMASDVRLVSPRSRSVTHHVVRERLAGWRHGLGDVEPVVATAPVNSRDLAAEAFRLVLDAGPRPTGVLCLSDELALGVLAVAADAGLEVPRDLSVVGFDDSPVAQLATPPLTTVHQPQRDKGRQAAELLVAALGGEQPPSPKPLPTELVVRSSTARPRRSR